MEKINLNGLWKFGETGKDEAYEVEIPGSVLSGLTDNKIIDDPYYRENEYETRDLFWKDYVFVRKFEVAAETLERKYVVLVANGLDTVADVFINGEKVLYADNMHRTWRANVKSFLKPGENEIRILFHSPLKYISEYRPAPEKDVSYIPAGGIKGNQYIRKAHSMFGWDWGAQLPDCGIWRDIYIESYDNRIAELITSQKHENGKVTVYFTIKLEEAAAEKMEVEVSLSHAFQGTKPVSEEERKASTQDVILDIEKGTALANGEIEVVSPKLWWTNDQGEQNLYELRAALNTKKGLIVEKKVTEDTKSLLLGLRTITVSQKQDEWGKEYALCVNGQKLFSMGADYIPEDCIYSRITRDRQEYLVKSAARAHYNTIRVWGGGYYPSDDFYDLCDKYGMVVWQDLMYACNIYDLTKKFEESISAETVDNVRRLRHHASLGFWCGNNEMESAWAYWGWDKPENRYLKADYIKMFEYILPGIIEKEDPENRYWPSSPSSGGCFDDPGDENRGDVHYWDVWHGQKPFTDYLKHYFRYCSEFGFQSFPELKTVETYTLPEDRNIFSPVMESHQKNDSANGKILYYLSENFRYPSDFGSLLYASQVLQAIAVKAGVDHWRRNRGRCMGAIYWQINDNWPVASWSSIDYFGRWKALHYMAVRFFAPMTGSILKTGENKGIFSGAECYAENESAGPIKVSVRLSLKDMKFNVIKEVSAIKQVEAYSALKLTGDDYSEILIPDRKNENEKAPETAAAQTVNRREAFVCADYEIFGSDGNLVRKFTETEVLVPYKYLSLDKPEITKEVTETEKSYIIRITSDCFTPFVKLGLNSADGIFSDNYFTISGAEAATIVLDKDDISGREYASAKELEDDLEIISLRDSYL